MFHICVRTPSKQHDEVYKGFVFHTEEGIERGIFFRNPIQRIDFSADMDISEDWNKIDAYAYIDKLKNPFKAFVEILIGNKHVVDHVKEWADDWNFAGFSANVVLSPIYFKRNYRELRMDATSKDAPVQRVRSYGFEKPYNFCGGACSVEKTKVWIGETRIPQSMKANEQYNYTYMHIIKEAYIDSKEKKTSSFVSKIA